MLCGDQKRHDIHVEYFYCTRHLTSSSRNAESWNNQRRVTQEQLRDIPLSPKKKTNKTNEKAKKNNEKEKNTVSKQRSALVLALSSLEGTKSLNFCGRRIVLSVQICSLIDDHGLLEFRWSASPVAAVEWVVG